MKAKTRVGLPWAGKEMENPTQTHVWRGLTRPVKCCSIAWRTPQHAGYQTRRADADLRNVVRGDAEKRQRNLFRTS
jgi:hypothetical protein